MRPFSGRIGRALTAGTAVAIAGVVLVGGVSLWLAFGVHDNLDATSAEYRHLLALGEVHSLFDDLIFELQQSDQHRQAEHAADAVLIHARLVAQIDALQNEHVGDIRPAERTHFVGTLQKLRSRAEALGATARRMRAGDSGLTSAERAMLVRITREVPELAMDVGAAHRARIGPLVDGSKRQISEIVALYGTFVVVGGALALLASAGVSHRIAAPLGGLVRASRRIARGRLETRVPVQSADEIGMLSRSFNVMAERLQHRERELRSAQAALERKMQETRALYRVGVDLSRLHHRRLILQYVVDTARELLGGDAIAVHLNAADGASGGLAATSGPSEAFRSNCTDDHGRPAEPKGSDERGLLQPAYRRGHLSANVDAGSRTLGTLHVGTREPRQFTEDEAQLLAALATQAAIAIERASMVEERRAMAAVEERGRLAREMHDGLAQALGLLNLKLQRAATRTGGNAALGEELREMVGITDHAYEDVRHAILGLRAYVLRGTGLVDSLTEYVREFQLQSGIQVELTVDDPDCACLPPAHEVQVVRIVQEALANVRKHAGVRHAKVRLECVEGAVRVTVADEGAGFDRSRGERALHYGLQTMRERAESSGGTLELQSAPGRGTRVVASFPKAAA